MEPRLLDLLCRARFLLECVEFSCDGHSRCPICQDEPSVPKGPHTERCELAAILEALEIAIEGRPRP